MKQLKKRLFFKKYKKKHLLFVSPFKKGTVIQTRIVTPKKPNSARRPVSKIIFNNKFSVIAHIPGIGHNLRKHSVVLVRGGGARDLPGVNYTTIRGKYDLQGVLSKASRRSLYGIPIPEQNKIKIRRKFRNL